jgi:SAM-dependent methyltransferase
MQSAVERHYGREGLSEAIRAALANLGKDPRQLTPEDLAPIDEFHVRGRAATLELAEKLKPTSQSLVLDVGAGLGGAARFLASTYGCRVIGIDVTEAYCRVATTLTQWTGLAHLVSFRLANALDLPFADYQFDAAWTQHAAMNIDDKLTHYAEAFRVLKPGGLFAVYDVLQGVAGPPHFPVPWAREPAESHLVTPAEMERLLLDAGFDILSWRDTTAEGRAWLEGAARRIREKGSPPLGMSLLFGQDFPTMAENMRRSIGEDRIALIEAVSRRPG